MPLIDLARDAPGADKPAAAERESRNLIAAAHVSFAYADSPALSDISFSLPSSGLHALIGPNGSGKTTLLKLLAGILAPAAGRIDWQGRDIRALSRRELARRVAFVPQELNLGFGLAVRELVMLGRTPHLRPFAGPTRNDRAVVERMLRLTETAELADRPATELSGGEKQRAVLAMALAQEPLLLLLDEPTVHLDLSHQVEMLELLRRLNREYPLTVLATMHDLNLASLYFDNLLMLQRGRLVASGRPQDVLSVDRIATVYDAAVQVQLHPTRQVPQIILMPGNS